MYDKLYVFNDNTSRNQKVICMANYMYLISTHAESQGNIYDKLYVFYGNTCRKGR